MQYFWKHPLLEAAERCFTASRGSGRLILFPPADTSPHSCHAPNGSPRAALELARGAAAGVTNGRPPVTVITCSSAIRRPRIPEVAVTEPLALRKLPFSSSQYGRGSLLAIDGGPCSPRRQRAPQPRFSEPRELWVNWAGRLKQYRQKKYGRSCLLNNIGKAIKLKKIV